MAGGDQARYVCVEDDETGLHCACFLSGASKTFSAFQSLAGPGSEIRHLQVGLAWPEMDLLLLLAGLGPSRGLAGQSEAAYVTSLGLMWG